MKERIAQILLVILAAAYCTFAQSNSWNGLTPLRSTRADVEKLFEQPKKCVLGCVYETKKETIRVYYADRRCDDGWNVEKGTVISFYVYSSSNADKSFDELKLDRSKFSYTVDDIFEGTWTNAIDGLSYHFRQVDKNLESIGYFPKKSDNQTLRCNGFPPYTPEGRHMMYEYTTFYSQNISQRENINGVCVRFQNLMGQLRENFKDNYKGYALIYFDNKMPFKQYEKYLARIKNCVFNQLKFLKFPPEQVTIIEGGMREESRIEFYILPNDSQPPAPEPTLPSPQFMRKQ